MKLSTRRFWNIIIYILIFVLIVLIGINFYKIITHDAKDDGLTQVLNTENYTTFKNYSLNSPVHNDLLFKI